MSEAITERESNLIKTQEYGYSDPLPHYSKLKPTQEEIEEWGYEEEALNELAQAVYGRVIEVRKVKL